LELVSSDRLPGGYKVRMMRVNNICVLTAYRGFFDLPLIGDEMVRLYILCQNAGIITVFHKKIKKKE
jgi:hypothetical protein